MSRFLWDQYLSFHEGDEPLERDRGLVGPAHEQPLQDDRIEAAPSSPHQKLRQL